ncbi:MAG TPA: hypothetical protein VGM86_23910 [Thermoanaerobaculia bacterium]|jgi:hypothetical protein
MKKNAVTGELKGRVLARVLAEDLEKIQGGGTKSTSCGRGCDEIVNDCWKLADDQV